MLVDFAEIAARSQQNQKNEAIYRVESGHVTLRGYANLSMVVCRGVAIAFDFSA